MWYRTTLFPFIDNASITLLNLSDICKISKYDVQIMTSGAYLNNCKKYKNVEKNTKKAGKNE